MFFQRLFEICLVLIQSCMVCSCSNRHFKGAQQPLLSVPETMQTRIPYSTRAHWMRVANQAPEDLISLCPFAAFGAAIVNHTSTQNLGDLICIGANNISGTGNPTLHGEMVAINNCTTILTNPDGPYGYTPSEVLAAWKDLTLYTNAESCPMCASVIRWAGFREFVYGTSIDTLVEKGWSQITISSCEVFRRSEMLGSVTDLIGGLLDNETDSSFAWQFDETFPCPRGCLRDPEGGCLPA